MTCAPIQSKIDYGYAKAGAILGQQYCQYIAAGPSNPLTGFPVNTLKAWITTDAGLQGTKPVAYGKPFWFAAIERSGLSDGDYIDGQLGTFYVNSLVYPAPVGLVQCNRNVTVTRMQSGVTAGLSPNYGGDVTADADTIIVQWPSAIFSQGSKGTANAMQLPNDSKLGTVNVLLPSSVPETLLVNDTLTDDFGNRYVVSNAELSSLGWRLTADLWKQG